MATSGRTDLANLAKWIDKTLGQYTTEVEAQLSLAIDETAKETIKKIRKDTPRLKNAEKPYRSQYYLYPRGNKVEYHNGEYTKTLHNKKYQLSHLLEDGHKVYSRAGKKDDPNAPSTGPFMVRVSKYGNVPRSKTYNLEMWSKAEDSAEKTLDARARKRLSNIK